MNTPASTATPPPDLSPQALALARQCCDAAGERLTPTRLRVYAELVQQDRAVSAYELLALLEAREQRKLAPLQVYRQLEFLIRVGLAHKLASSQSYVVCAHPDHAHDGLYLVCSGCGRIEELDSGEMEQMLAAAASRSGFKPQRSIIEVQGTCQDCQTR